MFKNVSALKCVTIDGLYVTVFVPQRDSKIKFSYLRLGGAECLHFQGQAIHRHSFLQNTCKCLPGDRITSSKTWVLRKMHSLPWKS